MSGIHRELLPEVTTHQVFTIRAAGGLHETGSVP